MKLLLFILCTALLFSCKKELVKADLITPLTAESTLRIKKEYQVSERTEPYSDRMFNTCLNEYVYLNGTVTYYIKESFSEGYYLDYIIDLKATGLGEFSGIVFKGGGKSVGRVRSSEDGTAVKGTVQYNIRYNAPNGNKMGFVQRAKFILKDDVTRVEFDNITPTCE
jgi:hypothetical protein